ncbi:MAG: flagellar type III secretion system pore protein FliP [Gammaproteobacteria bacterium]|nr:flagellar type III secretion system pore protein FliP [Gammaproteobacteria bacterium]MCP5298850.1 flagellar type III secretion system pore protein FliP [Chromatiaceae bacterium]
MKSWLPMLVLLFSPAALAAPGIDALTMTTGQGGEQTYTLSIQVLLVMTALSMLPAALILMTSFTRIVIVLSILRQALGTAQTPSNQILVGLALFLTFFIMSPVLSEIYDTALAPYLEDKITANEALDAARRPLREFMLAQTRDDDLALFARISGQEHFEHETDVPFTLLMPAFATSELKTAFQIGFLLFIPFLVIDLVVASVLMSMGMMMLSPLIISLPFKIMLFVLVDGWALVLGTLATSFYV